jgi:hypothetical protein
MRLTLLRAKEALKPFAPADKLEYRLNRVCERILTNAKFAGSMDRLRFRAPYGQVTLPRYYRTVEGVKVDGRVVDIANHWYEFLPGRSDLKGYSLEALRDLGDGLATMQDLRIGGSGYTDTPTITLSGGGGTGATASARLTNDWIDNILVDQGGSGYTSTPSVTISGSGGASAVAIVSGGTVIDIRLTPSGTLTALNQAVTIFGVDSDFLPLEIPVSANQTLPNTLYRIDRVHKEQGTASVVLFQTINTTRIDLAIMAPTEEETFYRRYVVDTLTKRPAVTVQVLAKRRHIEFTSDKDVLPISNLGALENGLNALQFEAENDTTAAQTYMGIAIDILNKELADTNSENSFPALRIHYAPGTAPNFRGFY